MAIRSLILSLALTGFLGYSFTAGLTDQDSFLRKLPEWTAVPLLLGYAILYVLAAWWAIKSFDDNKTVAIVSILFCAFGLGIFALGLSMEFGKGKAQKGQYDYGLETLDIREKGVLLKIVNDAGLNLSSAVFTEHWRLTDSTDGFRLCVQKGHITAMNFSGHKVINPALFSEFPQLGDLYLINCGLSDLSGMKCSNLDRLDVSDNQIKELSALRGCPNLRWIYAANNQIESTQDTAYFRQLIASDFAGNPVVNRSAN